MANTEAGLTGRWVGNYWQHSRPHPIHADLIQEGDRLTGSMSDGETDRDSSVFDVASEAGLPPGADEQIEAKLRELHPDVPNAPIRFITHLPEASGLIGTVDGRSVEFLKTYEGTHFGGYRVGDRLIGQAIENHSVHYRGRLSQDGSELEGRWWIESETGAEMRANNWGSFLLTRAAAR